MTITKDKLQKKWLDKYLHDTRPISEVDFANEIFEFFYPYINSGKEKEEYCRYCHTIPCQKIGKCQESHQESKLPEKLEDIKEYTLVESYYLAKAVIPVINSLIDYLSKTERFTIEKKEVDNLKKHKANCSFWLNPNNCGCSPSPVQQSWEEEFDLLCSPLGYIDFHKAKSFIRNLLKREREGVKKIIQKGIEGLNSQLSNTGHEIRKQALRDVSELLSAITSKDNK